ncbi:glycosyltransferase family 2 protein [Candidatus Pelagibacter sp.]|nr:glycosyltransferase family 2 protein [Candidatus Pelagibacter sp.]
MKILICICTYKRNHILNECLMSFNKAIIPFNLNIKFLIMDNTINGNARNIIKKVKKKFNYKIYYINEKKRGIVHARNKCLEEVKKINCDYFSFLDDDCEIDSKWFVNFEKIIKTNRIKIITGPQINKNDENNNNLERIFEKKINCDKKFVNWAATNNVILSKKVLLSSNLKFDINLNKFGMGEDQLFFLQLNKKGHQILWNKEIKVYERRHSHRSTIKWVADRSFRLGILGNYIDKKIYGSITGNILNFIKCIYYLFLSILTALQPFQKLYSYKLISFIYRSFGRLLSPFLFKKIEFYKK